MNNAIPIDLMKCPVCDQLKDRSVICPKCGWQYPLFSSRPIQEVVDELKKIKEIKKTYITELEHLQAGIGEWNKKIKEINSTYSYQKNTNTENRQNLNYLEREHAELVEKKNQLPDLAHIQNEVARLLEHQTKLESRLINEEYGDIPLPGIAFKACYNERNNSVEVEVIEIYDAAIQKISKFILGVAFSLQPLHHFLEADIFIPTKIIEDMTNLDLGQKTTLPLQYAPPSGMQYRQIIHLFYYNLSTFSIE